MHWHSSVTEIEAESDCFTIVTAHEFFDALPIHIFEVRYRLYAPLFGIGRVVMPM